MTGTNGRLQFLELAVHLVLQVALVLQVPQGVREPPVLQELQEALAPLVHQRMPDELFVKKMLQRVILYYVD
jgi:hypothetical protein